jgi:hypothetical protein
VEPCPATFVSPPEPVEARYPLPGQLQSTGGTKHVIVPPSGSPAMDHRYHQWGWSLDRGTDRCQADTSNFFDIFGIAWRLLYTPSAPFSQRAGTRGFVTGVGVERRRGWEWERRLAFLRRESERTNNLSLTGTTSDGDPFIARQENNARDRRAPRRLVPTVSVGMRSSTLCVAMPAPQEDAESRRAGSIPTRSAGTSFVCFRRALLF